MKYKLTRQDISPEINKIILRGLKIQKMKVPRATKNNLKEIAAVSKVIESDGLPKYLVLKKLKKGLGHGIFLHPKAKPILKGQVIAPYSGEITLFPQNEYDESCYAFSLIADITLTKEEQQLLDNTRRYHPRRLYSVDLDALKAGNFTRFINHSEEPNVDAEMVRIPTNSYGLTPSLMEIVYIANKTILPGEQLLVCYEDEVKSYWGTMKIKPVPITPKTFRLNASLQII